MAKTIRAIALLGCVGMAFASASLQAKDKYRPPRLSDGHPDLQGTWSHNNATPLVRPDGFSTLHISAAQAAQLESMVYTVLQDPTVPNDPTTDLIRRRVLPIGGTFRSSVVIEPADGQIPGTPLYQQLSRNVSSNRLKGMDGPEQRPTSERCLGNPASQPPILYNPGTNLHQIVQTSDTLIFFSEIMHDARVIRLNATHAPAAVTSWLGDSIGWWEGDTLVVETKYFTPSDTGRAAPFVGYVVSPQTVVTERFTRVGERELNYVFTVEDPSLFTRPWKGETHFLASNEQMFEYSCHEGNRSLPYILQGARVQEAAE